MGKMYWMFIIKSSMVLNKMSSQSNTFHKLKIKKHQTYDLKLWRSVTDYKQNENWILFNGTQYMWSSHNSNILKILLITGNYHMQIQQKK